MGSAHELIQGLEGEGHPSREDFYIIHGGLVITMEETIESNVVYEHDSYGEVLVTKIGAMTDRWRVGASSDNSLKSQESTVLVFFHSAFDGYGGFTEPLTEEVNRFASSVEEKRPFTQTKHSSLREE